MPLYEPCIADLPPMNALEAEAARNLLRLTVHELRAPLTRLKGYIELLQTECIDGRLSRELLQRSLDRMSGAADSLAELMKRLMEPSLSLDRFESHRRPMDLWSVVVAVAMHYPEVSVVDIETPGLIDGDSEQLEQVLINLLENARKYSPVGSRVRVFLGTDGTGVLLQVEDQGIGLPPGTNESIFTLHTRAANALALQVAGEGIGLHICRQIVQQHGGRIWAESDGEGHGATFNVWLPYASAS